MLVIFYSDLLIDLTVDLNFCSHQEINMAQHSNQNGGIANCTVRV